MGYSFRLAARILLYAPSHRQDSTYLYYTSRGALVGMRKYQWVHEGSIRWPIAPWVDALTRCGSMQDRPCSCSEYSTTGSLWTFQCWLHWPLINHWPLVWGNEPVSKQADRVKCPCGSSLMPPSAVIRNSTGRKVLASWHQQLINYKGLSQTSHTLSHNVWWQQWICIFRSRMLSCNYGLVTVIYK